MHVLRRAYRTDAPTTAFLLSLREKDAKEVANRCLTPLLETVVDTNDRLQAAGAQPPARPSIFRLKKRPRVPLKTYLGRLVEATGCSTKCLITALIYLDRVSAKEYPSTFTIHRLLLASLLLADKHTGDGSGCKGWSYLTYAQAAGVPESELKVLEVEMLRMLRYDLTVPPPQLLAYGTKIFQYKSLSVFRQESP
ncbi:hypothetical protein VYU27_008962 [Nannochloropsis oceanica]